MSESLMCGKNYNDGFKIYLYDKGEKKEILPGSAVRSELPGILSEMFFNVNSEMRLYVDTERTESIKKEYKTVEIIFDEEVSFKTKARGSYKFNRLMIPLSGDLAYDRKEHRIIFLTGNPEYSGSPLVSNCDELTIQKLLKIVDN
ncbi:MAG: hypothetical protein KDD00_16660 [Ignavibacteriae bacterium]|nr:hypothetical protein [Ignavibacteriota bacterium]